MQMEEDDGVLEFRASAGDLLGGESAKEVGLRNLKTLINSALTFCGTDRNSSLVVFLSGFFVLCRQ